MGKWTAGSGRILLALLAILPFGTLLFAWLGYEFQLTSLTAHSVLTTLLALCAIVLCAREKEPVFAGVDRVLFVLLAPLSLVCIFFHAFPWSGALGFCCALLCFGCCVYLSVRYGKPRVIWILTGTAAAALVMFFLSPIGALFIVFGNLGEKTVVRTVPSPDGAYYAEVIDDDQGALGGGTLVVVHNRSREFNAGLFQVRQKPREVYRGPWGEFKEMEVHWEDEHHLVVKTKRFTFG